VVLGHVAPTWAQTCDPGHLIDWPAANPVWRVCWVSPENSSGIDGSGLELTWVAYQGRLVLGRAHAPILNVKYDPGGCGGRDLSYRDWANELERFEADGVVFPGYAEPTAPPVTVCENPGTDVGSFYGVAAEKLADRLILSTQLRAGWYRYIQAWTFHLDGRLEPSFRFTAIDNSCTPLPHYHNVYWRFDFDVDGDNDDLVEEYGSGTWTPLTTEAQRLRDPASGRKWRVRDTATNSFWEIVPGPLDDVADAWAVADLWALAYGGSELDDGGATRGHGGDIAHLGKYVNGQSINSKDIVVWYRGGFRHEGPADCEVVGPSLVPVSLPALSIDDVSVVEGNSGTTNATFNVTLSPPSTGTVTVAWATADGTATAGSDYTAGSGTLTFPPGTTTAPVTVAVRGDTASEPPETFFVDLSGASGATIVRSRGQATIVNDDNAPGGAVYDPVLKAPKCGTVGPVCDSGPSLLNGRDGKGPEINQPNTINGSCADGTQGTYHVDESMDRIRVLTTDGSPLAVGKTARVEATVWAWTTPSDDKLDLYYTGNANSPSWTLIATLTPSAGGSQVLSATYTLPAGGLQAVRARFRFKDSVAPCGAGGYDDPDDLVFAVDVPAPPAPDGVPPTSAITSPADGASVGATATISASASDNVGVLKVEFYVDAVLRGTDTTAPYSFAWDTTSVANGSHALVTKAYDAAGNVGPSATVTVTVSNQTAAYDPALKAPRCGTVGALCDSGPSLLNGRDGKGPEVNQPNTINASCADGTQGTYHVDESTDRIRVFTTDGSLFAAGKTVRVEATVWAWTTPSDDKLDLYYAANANSPSWTFIATLTPAAAASQVLSATYTLPAGGLQAVRARFRFKDSVAPCALGSYDDPDDLIFAVQ
jgi:hypothetical protein